MLFCVCHSARTFLCEAHINFINSNNNEEKSHQLKFYLHKILHGGCYERAPHTVQSTMKRIIHILYYIHFLLAQCGACSGSYVNTLKIIISVLSTAYYKNVCCTHKTIHYTKLYKGCAFFVYVYCIYTYICNPHPP